MKAFKKKVVILGSGFAGYTAAKKLDKKLFDVSIVSPRNYFLFTPLLTSTCVGTIEARSIIEPVRSIKHLKSFYLARCQEIDFENQVVKAEAVRDSRKLEIPYDHLIIAVGAKNNTFGIPGVAEHSHAIRDIPNANAVRNQLLELLETAANGEVPQKEISELLHILVVGGGPTGVEYAAEIYDLITKDLGRWFPNVVDEMRISIIETREQILGNFHKKLGEYTEKRLVRRGIEIQSGVAVEKLEANKAHLSDGREVKFGLAIWSAGNTQGPLIKGLDFEKDNLGRLSTTPYLNLKDHRNVFALGDCSNPDNTRLPATAQVAEQQGRYVAKLLKKEAQDKKVSPFKFFDMGALAYIGGGEALADLPGLKWSGFSTYVFWRSVYFTKVVSFRNRILVAIDWFKAFIFGRDISRF